ncbi:MAG: hypothetical protein ACREPW_08910 [Candidatus Binataceae bacterium]
MKPYHVAALALLSWTLIITEPSPRTIKTGFPTEEACDRAADTWQANYKHQRKQGNRATYPNRRRRLARAVPPTKCVEDAKVLPPHL